MRKTLFFIFLLALDVTLSATTNAQTLPGSADGARVKERFEKPVVPPAAKARPAIGGASTLASPQGAESTFFILRGINIEGMTAYGPERFQQLYAGKIGNRVALSEIYDIARQIADRYWLDGYSLSRVLVPEQSIRNGIVRLRVVEGFAAEVTVTGDYNDSSLVRGMVATVRDQKPLNMRDFEQAVLLLNNLPGISAKGIIEPLPAARGEGAVRLLVKLEPKDKTAANISFDNYGSRYTGPYQLTASFARDNLLLPFSQTTLTAAVSTPLNELQYIGLGQTAIVHPSGTELGLSASYSNSEPGFRLKPQEVKSNAYDLTFSAMQPVLRSRAENLSLRGEFNAKSVTTDALSTELYHDELRVLRLSGSYDLAEGLRGNNLITLTLSQGIDVLGARETGSSNLSRLEGHSDFTKLQATLSRLQALPAQFSLLAAFSGQYAGSPLLSSEEFGYGGQNFGRAYDPSELTGDHGAAASAELRYDGLHFSEAIFLQPYLFYDAGKVWNLDNGGEDEAGTSAGAGIRAYHDNGMSVNFGIAQPLSRAVAAPQSGNGKGPRVLFSVKGQF